jgi:hypothetical protein
MADIRPSLENTQPWCGGPNGERLCNGIKDSELSISRYVSYEKALGNLFLSLDRFAALKGLVVIPGLTQARMGSGSVLPIPTHEITT